MESILFLLQPAHLISCFLCNMLGVVMGALPGLGGGLAIAIMLPISFGMDPRLAIAMMLSIWVGSCSGGFIGSILLGIPGTPASMSTCYDGYALTKKGEANRALSIGVVSNFLGTFPSLIIAMLVCTPLAKIAIKMGPWEYFSICAMAITLVIGLSKGRVFKGFIACGLGLFVRSVGLAPISSQQRFAFGNTFLSGGFTQMCIIIGLFAGSQILLDFAKGEEGVGDMVDHVGRFRFYWNDLKNNVVNIIRSFFIGLGIGIMPGMGASLSNVVSYATAKNSSKHEEEFGKGCIDGVIAPEVANNAGIGGAIIPMISLGIPGDNTTALLLGAMIIHGIEAGPMLQIQQPHYVQVIFSTVILMALITLVIEILGVPLFPKILKIPYHYLYPVILVFATVGCYTSVYSMWGVYQFAIFSIIAIWFTVSGIPSTPFLLSYILGGTLELNLRNAMTYGRGDWTLLFTRPVSGIFLAIGIICVIRPIIKSVLAMRKRNSKTTEKDFVE